MSTAQLVEARATDLGKIREMLEAQRLLRLDVVTSATALEAWDGKIRVATGEVELGADGVTRSTETYDVGSVFCEGLADRLGLPPHYLRGWQADRVDIFDQVVNRSLLGGERREGTRYPADRRKFLVRLLKADGDGGPGFARAFLSDKYRPIESLDALLAVLAGAKEAGITLAPDVCDLTERRCLVNLVAPQIGALAPTLLNGYRSPFDGQEAHIRAGDGDAVTWAASKRGGWTLPRARAAAEREGKSMGDAPPILTAGLRFSNSEVGQGGRTLVPYMLAQVCGNRLVLDVEADRRVHLGGELSEGIVEWSAETIERELQLITAQTRDAVTTFLSQEFLDAQVARVEELAGAPVKNPSTTVREVATKAGFTKAEGDALFDFFVEGGQPTAGGLANAVTAWAQTLKSGDRADYAERRAVKVMELAAAVKVPAAA